MSAVDRDTNVHPGHQEEGGESQPGELHLGPVGDDVGQVGGYQGVNPTTGSGKVNFRVCDGHQQRPGYNSTENLIGKP